MSANENQSMAIDIRNLIRSRRDARAQSIEELAQRLANGETVPPEEIETWLEQTGTDENLLQERIDCLERRSELVAAVAKGEQAQDRIGRIQADIDKAFAVVAEAQEKFAAVRAKHAEALSQLEQQRAEGNRAAEALLEPENLSPFDRDRLATARKAATAAAIATEDHQRNIVLLKASLEDAEAGLVDAQETAKQFRNDPGAADRLQRAKNAVNARSGRLKEAEAELPKLVAEAQRQAAALAAIEDDLRK